MRLLVTALTLFALVAPQAAQANGIDFARPLAQRASLIHGIAGDERLVFVTEPGIGVGTTPRVVALDRFTGREVAALPAPDGGFKLPFTLRVPETGHLVVLDSGGFPPPAQAKVYDYRYRSDHRGFKAELVRTVSDLPVGFAEDVEVLPNGEYVVSESVFGALWLIGRDGAVRPGLVPASPAEPLPRSERMPVPADPARLPDRRSAVRAAGRLRARRRIAGRARQRAVHELHVPGRRAEAQDQDPARQLAPGGRAGRARSRWWRSANSTPRA